MDADLVQQAREMEKGLREASRGFDHGGCTDPNCGDVDHSRTLVANTLRSLADAVETLTRERDEWKAPFGVEPLPDAEVAAAFVAALSEAATLAEQRVAALEAALRKVEKLNPIGHYAHPRNYEKRVRSITRKALAGVPVGDTAPGEARSARGGESS
jgi:hypothetical protein